jgi:small subunit ribosomal protein S5
MTDEKNDTPSTENTVKPVEEKAVEKTSEKPEGNKKFQGSNNKRGGNKRGRGRKERAPKEFEETVLQIDRVTRVTKGGRQLRFRISIVIGDKKGRVGFGIGKSGEVIIGIQKAIAKAKRNLIKVPIFNETIPHAVEGNFKASKVLLFPARTGKGIIAGGAVRKIMDLAGVKNVLSKAHGSRNRINIAYATFLALQELQNKAPFKAKEIEAELAEDVVVPEEKKEEKTTAKAKKPIAKSTDAKKPAKKAVKK